MELGTENVAAMASFKISPGEQPLMEVLSDRWDASDTNNTLDDAQADYVTQEPAETFRARGRQTTRGSVSDRRDDVVHHQVATVRVKNSIAFTLAFLEGSQVPGK